MFQQTLKKLTALNSIVFLLILITFVATLYGYVAYQLFDNVDDSMRDKANLVRLVNGRPGIAFSRAAFFDPRIIILLRDSDNRIISLSPFPSEELDSAKSLALHARTGVLLSRKAGDHTYRLLSIPYKHPEKILIRSDGTASELKDVIAVSIVDSEIAMLSNLLMIILTGSIISMMIVILAGYFLARRALVPIRAAWEKQQQFVADASHELRTPLTVIKTNAELLLRHPDCTIQEESARITNIIRETIRINKLVSTLLTLARADSDQLELNLAPVDLNDIIGAVVEQFAPLAEIKGVHLKADSDSRIKLVADRERLHQLLVILLDNAIKYTPADGRILLTCRRQTSQITLAVKDTGCGIPPEDLPKVFDRFFRGDKARSREAGGTGLGLAIAKWIVQKHDGKIKIESALGTGTQIYITLPVRKP